MALGIGPGLGVTRVGNIRATPGQGFFRSAGAAVVSFLANSPGTLVAVGAATVAFVGDFSSGGGVFSPSWDFSDARNSQYAGIV